MDSVNDGRGSSVCNGSESFFLDAGLYEGLAGFRYALRRFLKFSEAATLRRGNHTAAIPGASGNKVDPAGVIMIKDLADQMLTQHHSTVQLVDRLECRTGRAETLADRWPNRARRPDRNRGKVAGAVGFQSCQGAPQARAVAGGSA